MINTINDINVNFDFTSDTRNFWTGFWERASGLGAGGADPDSKSQTMRDFHRLLWSKPLPNGEIMNLEDGRSRYYLKWKDLYFGSDSITATFRYYRNITLIEEVKKVVPDYKSFVEDYLRKLYTIGGEMLFPAFRGGINQSRGMNWRISDRWDLTLECIRRFYAKEESPLSLSLSKNKEFFKLFVDFKGFVNFFLLQDCVDNQYQVKLWLETELFEYNPIPKTVESYLDFVNKELDFVAKRNQRIASYIDSL